MSFKQCKVCDNAQSKYKCPSCLLPYCSLGCFKKHKEIPCAKLVSSQENLSSNSVNQLKASDPERPQERSITVDDTSEVLRSIAVDDTSEVLLKPQLESIASSSEICNALKDKNLQKLIFTIDGASDPASELEKAMEVEVFRIFTDKILSTIDQ